jgi:hypothetical protein
MTASRVRPCANRAHTSSMSRDTRLPSSACAAIAKRVLGLLAVTIGGGVVLFFVGLNALR